MTRRLLTKQEIQQHIAVNNYQYEVDDDARMISHHKTENFIYRDCNDNIDMVDDILSEIVETSEMEILPCHSIDMTIDRKVYVFVGISKILGDEIYVKIGRYYERHKEHLQVDIHINHTYN